jgi:hypothetical protein
VSGTTAEPLVGSTASDAESVADGLPRHAAVVGRSDDRAEIALRRRQSLDPLRLDGDVDRMGGDDDVSKGDRVAPSLRRQVRG